MLQCYIKNKSRSSNYQAQQTFLTNNWKHFILTKEQTHENLTNFAPESLINFAPVQNQANWVSTSHNQITKYFQILCFQLQKLLQRLCDSATLSLDEIQMQSKGGKRLKRNNCWSTANRWICDRKRKWKEAFRKPV